jgi:transcriptional regulator with XRE-family HTH domain
LKARRLEAGLSQRELARMVGTNQTTIYQLEKEFASRGAYMKTIRKLAEVLKVQPADLICSDPGRKRRQAANTTPDSPLGPPV